ncbi:xyloglucan endotransglucosylase/hydrolase protein 31-like protein [Tanacetum coccineum]|uniref:Xyloglucan endotransglucosylase/hydrolase n=1 Tax=Tanacetum coccineum TaxID=301880 RepID=A0ABQ4WYQ6_9ASTR
MPLLITLLCLLITSISSNAQPSPGFYPSSKVSTIPFNKAYRNLWGPQHQRFDQNSLVLWLDRSSGSGFKSLRPYRSGYFSTAMKLHPGYTAGVITSFYLSNNEDHPGKHDEVDIEFLGTTFGKPYTLQTNVYIRGSGDGNIIGREEQIHLWFDPTKSFHNYAILWSTNEIMYNNFKIGGCTSNSPSSCRPPSGSPAMTGGLSRQQMAAMNWVHKIFKVYDYCSDPQRDHTQTPEC